MLSQTTQYAVAALIHLAQQAEDDYHQAHDVARRIHVPANYLGKILQKLARMQIVESQKGLHGGFRIARWPEQIRLHDILAALDALPRRPEPVPGDAEVRPISSIDKLYLQFLKDTTLADVIAAENGASKTVDAPAAHAPALD